ncbi:hypothetical protein Tco_0043262, partial [Tanacetum coccineum]
MPYFRQFSYQGIIFQYGENQEEAVMLRTFPFSLSGEAETCPTEGILDIGGIFLYNTSNEAFKILDDKVPLKLDLTDDSQNEHKPKTVVSAGGSNINPDHAILMDKFDALATKINFEFLKIRKDLNKIEDGRIDDEGNHNSDYHLK